MLMVYVMIRNADEAGRWLHYLLCCRCACSEKRLCVSGLSAAAAAAAAFRLF